MIGIIDIGSNTVRMNVYHVNKQSFSVLFSIKEMAGLVAQIENNKLLEAGLQNLIRILNNFKTTIETLNITEVYCFATASLRNIENQDFVLSTIQFETGFKVDLIDGQEEGTLGVIGAKAYQDVPKAILVDLGGGSCEVVPFIDEEILSSVSYPIGSLSLYKTFVSELLPTKAQQKAIKKFTSETINVKEIKKQEFDTVIGVGGTMRALLKVKQYLTKDYSASNVLLLSDLKMILKTLGDGSKESQDTLLKVVPDRIHTLIVGLCAIIELITEMGVQQILVSKNGVREGYLIKNVLKGE